MRRCLGLDIGSEVIKLVELQKKGKDAVLYTAAQTPTPPHGFSKGRVSDLEGLKKLCVTCWMSLDIKLKMSFWALPIRMC